MTANQYHDSLCKINQKYARLREEAKTAIPHRVQRLQHLRAIEADRRNELARLDMARG